MRFSRRSRGRGRPFARRRSFGRRRGVVGRRRRAPLRLRIGYRM